MHHPEQQMEVIQHLLYKWDTMARYVYPCEDRKINS